MNQCFIVEEYEQLKALSDPFRIQILNLLIEGSYTGQQIAQQLEIPRAKIHYHLAEMEKNGFIQVVRTETKNGIVQKFYRSVARSFTPASHLLPYTTEVGDYYRHNMMEMLNRARLRVLSSPEEAFRTDNPDSAKRPRLNLQAEVRIKEETFVEWLGRFRSLVNELGEMEEDPDGNWYYLAGIGLQIEEPLFDGDSEDCGFDTVTSKTTHPDQDGKEFSNQEEE